MRYLVAMRIIYENAELNLKRDLKSRRKLHIFRSENCPLTKCRQDLKHCEKFIVAK